MRISLRKTVQAAFLFGCLLILNSLYVVLDRRRNSITQVELQPDPRQQHGDAEKASDRSDANWGQSPFLNWLHPFFLSDSGHGRKRRGIRSRVNNFIRDYKQADTTLHKVFQPTSSRALVTLANRPTQLDDIFISVKTTKKFHHERLDLILDTWYLFAKAQTHFFTDSDDQDLYHKVRGHVVNTNCSSAHSRAALCCKMSVEYDTFMTSGKRWFCHVDDDTYVNVPALVELLQSYNHTHDWYLGKPSLNHPLEKQDIVNRNQKTLFWFATGGAGFCLSRAMALKMMPFTAGGKLWTVCDKIRLPDDCTVGFIIYYYLKKELTVIPNFHSHLEGLWSLKGRQLEKQITFSYGKSSSHKLNVVDVDGFNKTDDPTRFKSIHCALYPNLPECPSRR